LKNEDQARADAGACSAMACAATALGEEAETYRMPIGAATATAPSTAATTGLRIIVLGLMALLLELAVA